MPLSDVRQMSATRGDVVVNDKYGLGGAYYYFMTPSFSQTPGLAPYWSRQRDYDLRNTLLMEDMWASAVNKAIAFLLGRGLKFEDKDNDQKRIKRARELLMDAEDGAGWATFVSKLALDFLLTDSGAYFEIVRADDKPGARILGLMHLDSCRCIRTGNPEYPVVYTDFRGGMHPLKWYQVRFFSDLPSPSVTLRGIGFCAASRAYNTISKLSALETYVREKVTGSRPLSLFIVTNVNREQLAGAIAEAQTQRGVNGNILYMGAIVLPGVDQEHTPGIVEIPFSKLPDGFNAEQERDDAYNRYAMALGIPVQSIKPMQSRGQAGGGMASQATDDESAQLGLTAFSKQLMYALNEDVLAEPTTVTWAINDLKDQKARADALLVRAQARATDVTSGTIDPNISRQLAVNAGDVPAEYLPKGEVPTVVMTDASSPAEVKPGEGKDPASKLPNAPAWAAQQGPKPFAQGQTPQPGKPPNVRGSASAVGPKPQAKEHNPFDMGPPPMIIYDGNGNMVGVADESGEHYIKAVSDPKASSQQGLSDAQKALLLALLLAGSGDSDWEWDSMAHAYTGAGGAMVGYDDLLALSDGLIAEGQARAALLAQELADGTISLSQWRAEMDALVRSSFEQQYALGRGGRGMVGVNDALRVEDLVQGQRAYLNAFTADAGAGMSDAKLSWRAGLYAASAGQAFHMGRMAAYGLRLPAYPKDGSSECLANCGCRWEIDELDEGWNATWVRAKDDSCHTCIEREAEWNPLFVPKF